MALYMNLLTKEDNIRDLKTSFTNPPEHIDLTFDEVLRRIHYQTRRGIVRDEGVLTLIICTRRPFTVNEMLCTLAVKPGDAELDKDAISSADALSFWLAVAS